MADSVPPSSSFPPTSTPVAPASPLDDGGKPACGGGAAVGEYDLPIHVVGLFLVLAFSILGCGFPVVAKRVKWLKIPPSAFFACKHFGTGVLVATAFVHLLPTAFGSLSDPCLPDLFIEDYPAMPGVIMMGSMFCLFVIEMYLNAKTGGHSHGGPTGEAPSNRGHNHGGAAASRAPPRPRRPSAGEFPDAGTEKAMAQRMYEDELARRENPFLTGDEKMQNQASDMPTWFIVFYEQYVRQRLELINMFENSQNSYSSNSNALTADPEDPPQYGDNGKVIIDFQGNRVDPAVLRKMSSNITLLEGGILFHSVFVGITISLTNDGFIVLLIAILFHQMFEGLGLGSRIAEVPYAAKSIRPWVLVVAFGTTAPIGQAIGILARDSYDPESAFGLIIVGVFNAISSGLLIYAALVDLLAEDFLSEEAQHVMTKKMKIKGFCYVLLGAAAMSIVGIFA
ncbi:related to zinc transporter [Cephalotrichum gorgonifer]|uniref:Related to zinc transporter n=1 Tax=Cephalotrichum gorgonifer TaxID=2041049 RepID=A0AAE8N1U2_9PEZI|nr:related to zinc transporter [Cephalotrichum gorgonifer]